MCQTQTDRNQEARARYILIQNGIFRSRYAPVPVGLGTQSDWDPVNWYWCISISKCFKPFSVAKNDKEVAFSFVLRQKGILFVTRKNKTSEFFVLFCCKKGFKKFLKDTVL
jgi:hypothetical protein